MDRIRLALVLILFTLAIVSFACGGGTAKPEGEKEGATTPPPTVNQPPAEEQAPMATGPGEETPGTVTGEGAEGESTETGEMSGEEGTETAETVTEGNAQAGEMPGKAIYIANCTTCHRVTGHDDLGEAGIDLAGTKDKYDFEKMQQKLATHPPGGTPITETLDKQQTDDLIKFLLTL